MSDKYLMGQITIADKIIRIYVGGPSGYFHINPGGFCTYAAQGGNDVSDGEPVILTTQDLHKAITAYVTSKR